MLTVQCTLYNTCKVLKAMKAPQLKKKLQVFELQKRQFVRMKRDVFIHRTEMPEV